MRFLILFLPLLSVANSQSLLTLIPSDSSSSGSSGSATSGSSSGGENPITNVISTVSDFLGGGADLTESESTGLSDSWIASIVRDPPIEHVNLEETFPSLFSDVENIASSNTPNSTGSQMELVPVEGEQDLVGWGLENGYIPVSNPNYDPNSDFVSASSNNPEEAMSVQERLLNTFFDIEQAHAGNNENVNDVKNKWSNGHANGQKLSWESHPDVQAIFQKGWEDSVLDSNGNVLDFKNRREQAAWIYPVKEGNEIVGYKAKWANDKDRKVISATLPQRPPGAVGIMHTHPYPAGTRLRLQSGGLTRVVRGFSDADRDLTDAHKLPHVVLTYEGTYRDGQRYNLGDLNEPSGETLANIEKEDASVVSASNDMGAVESLITDILGINNAEAGTLTNPAKALAKAKSTIITKSDQMAFLTSQSKRANGGKAYEYGSVLGVKNGVYRFGETQKGKKLDQGMYIDHGKVDNGFKSIGVVHSHPNNDAGPIIYKKYTKGAVPFNGSESTGGTGGLGNNVEIMYSPTTGLSGQDILNAYRRNTFVVAVLPNGDKYSYYPSSSKTSSNASLRTAVENGVFRKF